MKKTRIRKISKRLSSVLAKYDKAKKGFLAEHTCCEVCARFIMTCVHHKKGRAGSFLWNNRYFMAVCNECHKAIHDNPKWAYEKGYLLDRLAISSHE